MNYKYLYLLVILPVDFLNWFLRTGVLICNSTCYQFISEVSVLLIRNYFSGSGSYLDLNFGSGFESGSGLFMKKYIRNAGHLSIAKRPDCL
jgi:hypothetical protein